MPKSKITVTIKDRTYTMEGDLEDADQDLHWNAVAKYVEEKLKFVEQDLGEITTTKQHIFAALLIAHELYALREKREVGGDKHATQYDELVKLLDDSLR